MKEDMTLDNVPLINDSLRGVYPFDSKMSKETEKMVAFEVKNNPSYGRIFLKLAEELQKKTMDEYFKNNKK
jgi:hypothetical protein